MSLIQTDLKCSVGDVNLCECFCLFQSGRRGWVSVVALLCSPVVPLSSDSTSSHLTSATGLWMKLKWLPTSKAFNALTPSRTTRLSSPLSLMATAPQHPSEAPPARLDWNRWRIVDVICVPIISRPRRWPRRPRELTPTRGIIFRRIRTLGSVQTGGPLDLRKLLDRVKITTTTTTITDTPGRLCLWRTATRLCEGPSCCTAGACTVWRSSWTRSLNSCTVSSGSSTHCKATRWVSSGNNITNFQKFGVSRFCKVALNWSRVT